jgi:hypothetical protein
MKDFHGGLAANPQEIHEAKIQKNLEVTREKWLRTILGTSVLNSNSPLEASTKVVGLGQGSAGTNDYALLAITNTPKVWETTSRTAPAAFTDITGGAVLSSSQNYWSFTQFTDGTNNRIIIFGNSSNGLWQWNGTGNISSLAAAPANPIVVVGYAGYLVAAVAPTSIYVSALSDPTTWPISQIFTFGADFGPISGLAVLPNKLLIFFQTGIGMIPSTQVTDFGTVFTRLHLTESTIYPLSISTFGAEVAYCTSSGPVMMDSTGARSEFLGEQLREFFQEQTDAGFDRYGVRGMLTQFHYFITLTDLSSSRRTFVYDRRAKSWWELAPPVTMFPTCWVAAEFVKASTLTPGTTKLDDVRIGFDSEFGDNDASL